MNTPEIITELKDGEVFVFGSNLAGRHGAGAALMAKTKFGARTTCGFGYFGRSYAIPTKGYKLETLPLVVIAYYVRRFLIDAEESSNVFLVTKIGCGLAGYNPEEIKPMFVYCPSNVILPVEFE